MDDKRVLLDLTPEELGDFLKSLGQPAFRAGQVFTWLHRGVAFADMGNLPATLRAQLNETCVDLPMAIQEVHPSRRDDTVKFLFACRDGNVIEGVLMRYRYGYSLCISTQVGCKMAAPSAQARWRAASGACQRVRCSPRCFWPTAFWAKGARWGTWCSWAAASPLIITIRWCDSCACSTRPRG